MRSVLLIAVVCGLMACEGSEAQKTPTKTEAQKTPTESEAEKTPTESEAEKTPTQTEAQKTPTESEAEKPRWDADQFAGRGHQSLERMWQGTWVMPFRTVTYKGTSRPGDAGKSAIGMREIWTLEGSTLSRYEGVRTETLTLEVIGTDANRRNRA